MAGAKASAECRQRDAAPRASANSNWRTGGARNPPAKASGAQLEPLVLRGQNQAYRGGESWCARERELSPAGGADLGCKAMMSLCATTMRLTRGRAGSGASNSSPRPRSSHLGPANGGHLAEPAKRRAAKLALPLSASRVCVWRAAGSLCRPAGQSSGTRLESSSEASARGGELKFE